MRKPLAFLAGVVLGALTGRALLQSRCDRCGRPCWETFGGWCSRCEGVAGHGC